MPNFYRHSIFILALSSSLSSYAINFPDTTIQKKNVTISGTNSMTDISQITDIQRGLNMIRADSMEQGIHLVTSGVKHTFAATKLDRIMNFSEMEFIGLVEDLDNGKLSEPEKKLGTAVFRIIFQKKIEPNEKTMEPYFKDVPNTRFVKRVRLMLQTDDRKAQNMLDGLLKEYPDVLSFNILKAEIYFRHQKYAEASAYCDKAIALWPFYAYAYNLKAQCEGNLQKYDKEAEDEGKALSLFDHYPEAWYHKAGAYLDMEKYKEAVAGYRIVDHMAHGYLYTSYFLAKSYKSLDNADSALYYVNQHIWQHPDDEDGYDLKGDLYYGKDDYPAAVENYDQAIKIDPKNSSFYEDRGNAYFYWKKVDTAMIDFRKATELDKKDYYAFERIGDCYYDKEDYKASIQFHEKALKIDPDYKYALVSLDLCYDRLGNHQLALEYCKKALSIDSTYANALGNLGWEYYCTGHYDECIDYSYRCLKYDETATYAMFNIALATLRKGNFDKAKDLYKHFLSLCKEKNYEMTGGAVTDLHDLIKANVNVDQAKFIIQDIFDETP